ncbi:ferric reductase-like transmembrane domain-containing protein [Deinococcus koreensis]|uniref:ferric reductase-like transmembrane domain-containing protein n=1 Tax=Deinococcus koreensis TaxID=2054903 RepID=UPI001057208E|nr:ferric reductase-like transmembrane domain-containing protein [Deinococcus koreensis]
MRALTPDNERRVAALLAGYGGLYLACWIGLGPATLAWSLNRALGVTAYLALALGVTLGALLGSRLAPPWLARAAQAGWHSLLTTSALVLGTAHGLMLTVDRQDAQPLQAVLIPGASEVLPFAVGLGTLGAYALLLVWGSTALRARLSRRVWHGLHLLAYPAFALLTWHGLAAGSDPLGGMYALAGAGAALTLVARVREERRRVR